MSTITIKDLTESIDLDRKAMLAIVGGARRSGYLSPLETRALHSTRLVDYPAGFGRTHLAMTRPQK
ncbi:hypothetical protein [Noviherbaspirillum sedimenti]|uniref:Uncharacterized protein n=1 Tax=Noviherbaspirillum sedimenti TaxID=2320865 RepID=A0A3A3GT35_9BURK|nr:hypothetical protein [Noviherbaspirillum sedimenti]RJG04160.1 hypothetical protein D3878_01425 [Noviherbaspirillum sedimenti]